MSLKITNINDDYIKINLWDINENFETKSILIDLASKNFDVLQALGRDNRKYVLTGMVKTNDQELFLENINGKTGKLEFDSEIGLLNEDFKTWTIAIPPVFDSNHFNCEHFDCGIASRKINFLPVYFINLKWFYKRPMERKFFVEVIERGVTEYDL